MDRKRICNIAADLISKNLGAKSTGYKTEIYIRIYG